MITDPKILIAIVVYSDEAGFWARADFGFGPSSHGPFGSIIETMTHVSEFMAVAANDLRAVTT